MTLAAQANSGAPSTKLTWDAIQWQPVEEQVNRLQMRIAKATREGRYGKVKALQWLLTHSYSAKLFAVKRVMQNKGSKTSGVDKTLWSTDKQKLQGAQSLKRRGYNPLPLKRIYIPKKKGLRPLSIPTMKDRAMQCLHAFALLPVAETTADINSYGFRPKRSCIDAIEQCFRALSKKASAEWILEGDIKSCFDEICHKWMLDNITTDIPVFKKWIKCGFIEKNIFHATTKGVSQGSVISPTASNVALDGLEVMLKRIVKQSEKVNYIRYADDFVITGNSKEVLENKIKPALIAFLNERGLRLSEEKTKITHINEGFNFLGFNLRKYEGKLLIKPSKEGIKTFLDKIRQTIKSNATATTLNLIRILNPMIQGWGNYYRNVVAKETFEYVDAQIFKAIWRWIKRRHPMKSAKWMKRKYYQSLGQREWMFHDKFINDQGEKRTLYLFRMASIEIRRHIKLKGKATPFDPEYAEYFNLRTQLRLHRIAGSHKP